MSTAATKPSTKPARSPVERAFVWTVIAIGLVVILMEGKAYMAHASALGTLQTKLKEFNDGETDGGMTKEDVDKILGGATPEESNPLAVGDTAMGASRLDIYGFQGLVRKRQLYVYYGIAGKQNQAAEVMEVSTGPSETLEQALAKLPAPIDQADAGSDAPGSPPGGGSPSGAGPMGPPGGMPPGGAGPRGAGPSAPGQRARGGAGRPTVEGEEKKSDTKNDAGDEKKDVENKKPEADAKPETEKPAEEKPAEEKAPEAKPEAKDDSDKPEEEKAKKDE